MSTLNVTIGVIGLGTMGKNIALNIAENGYKVHVFNRTLAKTKELEKESENIKGFSNFEEFVSSLQTPKKILLMVTAGQPVEDFLIKLKPLLCYNDIVIDGGNSYYVDTMRRSLECPFHFVGCGISGGEYGARYGPAMFFGCNKEVYLEVQEIFEKISAKANDKVCCGWMGDNGAGHFVKAVHNGIEYCIMQILQDITNVLYSQCKGYSDAFVREVFNDLNIGNTKGYLTEICTKILRTADINGKVVLDQIVDRAEQKGTGKMCIYSGVEQEAVIGCITESVFARNISSQKERRMRFAAALLEKNGSEESKLKRDSSIFKNSLHLCMAISFIQGCDLLEANKKAHNWSFTIPAICDVWSNGCILRCEFLNTLREMCKHESLETSPVFLEIYTKGIDSLKDLCKYALIKDIHTPLLFNCLSWLSGMKQSERNGTMIQAMRDFFGRHGVVLKTGERKSIEWSD